MTDHQDTSQAQFEELARTRAWKWTLQRGNYPWVLTYDDVWELLGDRRLAADAIGFLEDGGVHSGPYYDAVKISPLSSDGPRHRKWRAVMIKEFTPERIEHLRGAFASQARYLINKFIDRGSCEFVSDFASHYPLLGLCRLVGIPETDITIFRQWTLIIGQSSGDPLANRHELEKAIRDLSRYTDMLVAEKRNHPGEDLISRLAVQGKDVFGDDMIRVTILALIIAGLDTTKNQLGLMIDDLSKHPQLWDGVAEGHLDPGGVVEEVLRFRSTNRAIGRKVTESFERKGVRFEAGQRIILSLWSANHDEARFRCPHKFDPEANGGAHLAFARGPHFCLGAALVRVQLQEALSELCQRMHCPRVGLNAQWKMSAGLIGPVSLPLSFTPRKP